MNRADLRRRLQTALNDPDGVVFDDAHVHAMLADAQEVLAEQAPSLTRTFQIPRRAGWLVYTLDGVGPNLMAPTRVWLPDLHRRLEAITLAELDARHQTWMTVTGDPFYWCALDWRQFLVWPIPTTGGAFLEVDCVVWPDVLQDDGDEPEFPPADHEALVLHGEVDGLLEQWDVARAADVWGQFIARAGRVRSRASVEPMASSHYVRGSTGRGGSAYRSI